MRNEDIGVGQAQRYELSLRRRALAITDLETSGLDPKIHEILEMGLIVVDQDSLEVLDTLELKVRPEHIETASQSALLLNGYNEGDWNNAVSLKEAMLAYSGKTKGTIFCSHNVTFDWAFTTEAFSRTGLRDEMDYHRVDLFSVAWSLLRTEDIEDFNLDRMASYLGIQPEPLPHRAMNGAWIAYRVLKALTVDRGYASGGI